jgi:invasion protein IalB
MEHRSQNPFAKRPIASLALPLLAVALVLATAAEAAYVTYLRAFGDWSVACALDEPTRYRWCTLQAPPPTLFDGRSEIAVAEQRDGSFLVTVRVRDAVLAGAPVYLRIDDHPPYRAEPTRIGEATWRGAEAAAIVEDLQSGLNMVVRWFPTSDAQPRDEQFSLDGFAIALADYRARLR